ncbi:MAG: excinuclease ABC subunit UvrC [Actinobacteria bacterium]|nr:excinuclease ABC subunit UvrC [Actinomycetota bacterium]MCG2819143.1 excinuclease ABC subunit UvrC [Actinomycetes bacterium]MBU4219012.1 excinuclease ABC subunit UvrC [Actinomycetota bacterium]MBU4359200.1 excinuclease ABC subunit UvrC [Actinomycetota bacterium]MBU4391515.1 excinuclease ABC subunit UvrC [Actinomycetota bacterium]
MRKGIEARLKALPDVPGVYVFRDGEGRVIYVGKARSLRDRVRSYFRGPAAGDYKGEALRGEISDLEVTVCDSEVDALILEETLIKRHQPRFNVLLKDDKSYPFIAVTVSDEFPRVMLFRGKRKRGVKYYGPYVSAGAARRTMRLLERIFPLRHCRGKDPGKSGGSPCLYRDMGLCLGPCTGDVDPGEYGRYVEMFTDFLEGRHRDVLRDLDARMWEASRKQEYERAARIRNQIQSAEEVLAHRRSVSSSSGDYDVIGVHTDRERACFSVARNRGGFHIGNLCFFNELPGDTGDGELVCEFVKRYYGRSDSIPEQILVPEVAEDEAALSQWLSIMRGARAVIRVPERGPKMGELSLAEANARVALEGADITRAGDRERIEAALSELAEGLGLSRFPLRIECYDISTMGGAASVGSMVLFVEGFPARRAYRRYRIKFTPGIDDVGMMKEVLYRRFKRFGSESVEDGDSEVEKESTLGEKPDLVLLDGGVGQLGAGREVLDDLGIEGVDIAALAKRFEEVYRPGRPEPVLLPRGSEALFLLQRIRDEAHRVAVSYHRSLMEKATADSWLDQVAGVGPARKKRLVRHFGSPGKVSRASLEELESAGIPAKVAEAVFEAARSLERERNDAVVPGTGGA